MTEELKFNKSPRKSYKGIAEIGLVSFATSILV